MNSSFPILLKHGSGQYVARPLLFSDPEVTHRWRDKAIFALEKAMEDQVGRLIHDHMTEEALRRLRSPQFRLFSSPMDVDQSGIFLRTYIAFVCWKERGIEFLTAPFLENFFFTVPKGESAEDYAPEALTLWIRNQKEKYDAEEMKKKLGGHTGTAGLETVTGTLVLPDGLILYGDDAAADPHTALLSEGRSELRQIGREHRFFSDTRKEPVQPEKIARLEERLRALLTGSERKSAILLGGSFSGRTRMIEATLRRIDRDRNHHAAGEWIRNADSGPTVGWTLSPGAMIAGMSITGQWEHRTSAIFEFAADRDLILHFEPFPGFLEAGKTIHGGLSIADVIRSELTRERFRAVIELTPEELRRLREKDRLLTRRFEILEMPHLTHEEEFEVAVRTFQSFIHDQKTPVSPIFLTPFFSLADYFESEKAAPGRVCRWILPALKRLRYSDIQGRLESERGKGGSYASLLLKKALDVYQEKTGQDVSFFRIENTESPDGQTEDKTDGHAVQKWTLKRRKKERSGPSKSGSSTNFRKGLSVSGRRWKNWPRRF